MMKSKKNKRKTSEGLRACTDVPTTSQTVPLFGKDEPDAEDEPVLFAEDAAWSKITVPAIAIATPAMAMARYSGTRVALLTAGITRQALRTIAVTVGVRPPETGAKLFGPVLNAGVDLVEFDEHGSAHGQSCIYSPDTEWGTERVQYWMNRTDGEQRLWVGDVHSHPGGWGRPSKAVGQGLGDIGYAQLLLREHGWLDHFYIFIVTGALTGACTLWSWVVRQDEPEVALYLPLCILEAHNFPVRVLNEEWEPERGEDVASTENRDTQMANMGSEWDDQDLLHIIPEPSKIIEVGDDARGIDAPPSPGVTPERYYARLTGIVSQAFHDTHIAVIGVGGGSNLTLDLCRMGPRKLTLIDPDRVEVSNLCRTAFTVSDLGLPKAQALARHVKSINPFIEVTGVVGVFDAKSPRSDIDLVIAGTDSFEAQAAVNLWALKYGVPAVFIGLHALARGGLVIWVLPGVTPCYRCVASARYEAASSGGASLNLSGQAGSVLDTTFIDTVAGKIVVALLEREQDSEYGAFFRAMQGRTQVIVRMHPLYRCGDLDVFDVVLGDLPKEPKDFKAELKAQALLAMDTLWLTTEHDPHCPDCKVIPCVKTDEHTRGDPA